MVLVSFLVRVVVRKRRKKHGNMLSISNHTTTKDDNTNSSYTTATSVPLSVFLQALSRRTHSSSNSSHNNKNATNISKVYLRNNQIYFQTTNHHHPTMISSWKKTYLPQSEALQRSILEQLLYSIEEMDILPPSLMMTILSSSTLVALLPFVYLYFVYRIFKGTNNEHLPASNNNNNNNNNTTWNDVAGMDHIRDECAEILHALHAPQVYHSLGARAPRGLLLYGPPGTGKTLLARALLHQKVDAFVACSASAFVEMYVGRGAARVRNVFAQVQQQAKQRRRWWSDLFNTTTETKSSQTPTAILFIDELDALGKTRSGNAFVSNDEREQTLNQLLSEMDGFHQDESVRLVVIAATNRIDVLDPAILRRFERQIHVPYPSEEGRIEILKLHASRTKVGRLDWRKLARETGNFSGADLRNVVNEAALLAVRAKSSTVGQDHFEHAIRRIRANKDSYRRNGNEIGSGFGP